MKILSSNASGQRLFMKLLNEAVVVAVLTITATVCSAQSEAGSLSLEQQLLREQISNQKAQAAYYQKQSASTSVWDSLQSILMSVMGTFIGASLALVGVRWSINRQWEIEQRKWRQTKQDETLKEARLAVATLAQKVAAEIQAMIWLTWIAKFEPNMLSENDIITYDKEMKSMMGEDMVAQAALIAVDPKLHDLMKPLVKEASSLDHRMSFATLKFKQADQLTRVAIVKELGHFYDEAYGLYENLPNRLGLILETTFSLKFRVGDARTAVSPPASESAM